MAEYFLGEIRLFAFNTYRIPANFLPCDGRILDIKSYEQLYAVIGAVYGGDGVRSFRIPDMRGRVPVSVNSTSVNAPGYNIGNIAGAAAVTITRANIPAHTHTVNVSSTTANTKIPSPSVAQAAAAGGGKIYCDATQAGTMLTYNQNTISASDNSILEPIPHKNIQPTISLTYAICTSGLFPYHS